MRKEDAERKMRSAEKLFDAIGLIDDSIIADASEIVVVSNCPQIKKKPTFMRRYAVSLAAVLLAVVMVSGFVVTNLPNVFEADLSGDNLPEDVGNATNTSQTLDFVLSTAVTNPNAAMLSIDEIDFFDGEVSLIWNYGNEGEYHKLTFEAKNTETEIKNCMSKSVEQIPAENAEATVCKVWVSYGNGEVVSPYLKESAGNIGYATLFDYSPEVVPSESFTDLVSNAFNY